MGGEEREIKGKRGKGKGSKRKEKRSKEGSKGIVGERTGRRRVRDKGRDKR